MKYNHTMDRNKNRSGNYFYYPRPWKPINYFIEPDRSSDLSVNSSS